MASGMETLGKYQEKPAEPVASETSLQLSSSDLLQHWRRVSLSSDFLAKYYSFYFPYREKAKGRISREAAENSVSFVLNELIENTAKYSNTADTGVQVRVLLLERTIQLEVSNYVSEKLAAEFQDSMREVLGGNTEQLYLSKLEANLQEARSDSGLGFLTLINDYQVELGFKFENTGTDIRRITVQASMNCEEA
jgi:hypothetical protein